jgi:hypothetical protein
MSPVSTNDTPPYRSSRTSESSFRTRCRSQSGNGGCTARTRTSSIAISSPRCTVRQAAPARPALARSAAITGSRGTGTPSQTSRAPKSRTIRAAPPA